MDANKCNEIKSCRWQRAGYDRFAFIRGKGTLHGRTEPMLKDTNTVERAVTQHIRSHSQRQIT